MISLPEIKNFRKKKSGEQIEKAFIKYDIAGTFQPLTGLAIQ
jgi:hypothetical protein